jgi:hypothetical protein
LYHEILRDARLYDFLLKIDRDLAASTRAGGCAACGGRLHSARYPRKARGGPGDLRPEYEWRLSFCCAVDGCRQRATPVSVRFLGRRVYLGVVVLLVAAMTQGVTPRRAAELRDLVGVKRRTLERWQSWWRGAFATSSFWQSARSRFMPPVEVEALPGSLLERFGELAVTTVTRLLQFLAPITTSSPGLVGARTPVSG